MLALGPGRFDTSSGDKIAQKFRLLQVKFATRKTFLVNILGSLSQVRGTIYTSTE